MSAEMRTSSADARLRPPRWRSQEQWRSVDRKITLLVPVSLGLSLWYFEWLLRPSRVGNPILYGLLVLAELFNFFQAFGFWWTSWRGRGWHAPELPCPEGLVVDVIIPVYSEPVEIVEPTVAAASAMRGANVQVVLADDAGRAELEELARRHGARYVHRDEQRGAKAGNLNYVLRQTNAPLVAVFDCDHVPLPQFLEKTLGCLVDPRVAYVQTPQYYANSRSGRLAAAAASQQVLFFGAIARGKARLGAMFCCGTNVVFRRSALEEVGGFPEGSLTEDFALSIHLHELGWKSAYVNEVLALGLGPEDMASYVSQQQRWARGCLAALPMAITADLPFRLRMQYVLSAMFFLSGWTFALYMALPAIRIFVGIQPLAGATANQFLVHFAPYFGMSLFAVALAGGGDYTFGAFALLLANYFVQILSSLLVLTRRRGRFVVTAKRGQQARQPQTVIPALLAILGLSAAIAYALDGRISAGSLNNVAFATLHISVLLVGAWPALVGASRARLRQEEEAIEPLAVLPELA